MVKRLPGAVDVVADPIRGKPYLEIRFDRDRAARLGVSVGEANEVIETALAGQGRHRRRSRAASGTRWSSATPATSATTRKPSATSWSRRGPAAKGAGQRSVRQVPLCRGRRGPGRRGPGDDQGRERPLAQLRAAQRPRPRRGRLRRRGPAASWPARSRLPDGVFLEWTGQFEHEVRARRTLPGRRADRGRADLPDPLPDLSRPGRRRAHAADRARARSPAGSSSSGCWARSSRSRSGSATSPASAWRPRPGSSCSSTCAKPSPGPAAWSESSLAESAPGRPRRGRPPAAAQAPDRGDGRHRPGPDALGQRRRLRDHPPDGRPGAGRHPRRRRGGRPASCPCLLLRPSPPPVDRRMSSGRAWSGPQRRPPGQQLDSTTRRRRHRPRPPSRHAGRRRVLDVHAGSAETFGHGDSGVPSAATRAEQFESSLPDHLDQHPLRPGARRTRRRRSAPTGRSRACPW